MLRQYWESFWDLFTICTVFFFKGWQYVSVIVGIFTIYTMLKVSDFNQNLPESMQFNMMLYAIVIMLLIVIGAGAFGSIAYYKAGKRENNMALHNSSELHEILKGIMKEQKETNERLKKLENK
jgi:hypothetical protein